MGHVVAARIVAEVPNRSCFVRASWMSVSTLHVFETNLRIFEEHLQTLQEDQA
jgi:hypothetical protein